MAEYTVGMGWWVIAADELYAALEQCEDGETAAEVYERLLEESEVGFRPESEEGEE